MERGVKISNPNIIRIVDLWGRQFILFGDIHRSQEGICEEECIDYIPGIEDKRITENNNCYTVAGSIDKIITTAYQKGEYVDIYFEMGFDKDITDMNSALQRKSNRHKEEIIVKTALKFSDCFYKIPICPYNNARFHYADIRHSLHSHYFAGFLGPVIDHNIRSITAPVNFYSLEMGVDSLKVDIKMIVINILIDLMLGNSSIENSRIWKYYVNCIESDDFANQHTHWVEELLSSINNEYLIQMTNILINKYRIDDEYTSETITKHVMEIPDRISLILMSRINPNLVVHRRGKVMHRIRAQLEGLELQGDANLAESIRQFTYGKMKQVSLSDFMTYFRSLYNEWMGLMVAVVPEQVKTHISNIVKLFKSFYNEKTIMGAAVEIHLLDIYTLARMFRRFPIEYQKEEKPLNPHNEATKIILLAGTSHVNNIAQFLASQGGIVNSYTSLPDRKRCVVIPNSILN